MVDNVESGYTVLYIYEFDVITVSGKSQQPMRQESLANAKVSARQPWYIEHNSQNHTPLAFFTVTLYNNLYNPYIC